MAALARLVATGLYTGYLRPYPAVWGTLLGWILGVLLLPASDAARVGWAAFAIVVSVGTAQWAETAFGHDHRRVVIDEIAGVLTTLALAPASFPYSVLAFFAFRLFDNLKLPPVRRLEGLPGGWGVTLDDVAAGLQAALLCRILAWVYAIAA
jgi:phosphatidylglycerophosphatase A